MGFGNKNSVIFKTGKETFILRGNVQNQSKNKERTCLK